MKHSFVLVVLALFSSLTYAEDNYQIDVYVSGTKEQTVLLNEKNTILKFNPINILGSASASV